MGKLAELLVNDCRHSHGCTGDAVREGVCPLYFYPPLKAHPLFYLGAALLIVGSWIPLFSWANIYVRWKKENPETKTPLAVVGTLVNFTIWFVCTLAVAYEVLVLLLPWAMGWKATVNVTLARTLFWFFGHALVIFGCPAYIMYYTILPKLPAESYFQILQAAFPFSLSVILCTVGVHHQFSDPSISRGIKMFQGLLTFGVAIPVSSPHLHWASLEYAGKKRGSEDIARLLPNFLSGCAATCLPILSGGLILFYFGGLTGIVNASGVLNAVVP
jgi:cytochrome c oxidase subunit 1